jgi:DNA (cytosine-5)-methyltransferase 1
MRRIKLLDGCSGIGGNSYAFHSFAETRLYSELKQDVIPILRTVMRKGYIDQSPVVGDILKISKEDIDTYFEGEIDMLAAGYPCQGNSAMGFGLGLDDSRSGLIKGIFDKVRVWKPKFVFLENVPEVLRNGSARYVADNFAELGYVFAWGVVGAEHVGFRHGRLRWFCLAILPEHLELLRKCVETSEARVLERQLTEPVRMVPQREVERLGALGNSVVPQSVKLAFERLGHILLEPPTGTAFPYYCNNLVAFQWAYFSGESRLYLDAPSFEETRFRMEDAQPLVLIPGAYACPVPPSSQCTYGFLSEPHTFYSWNTPRHGNPWACNYLTKRSICDIGTQIRFEKDTPDEIRGGFTAPQFLEYLMGYPLDYTEIVEEPEEVVELEEVVEPQAKVAKV